MTGHWNGKQSILLQYRQLFLYFVGENNAAVGVFILFQTFIHPLCHCVVDLCLTIPESGTLWKILLTFYFQEQLLQGTVSSFFSLQTAFIAIGNEKHRRNRIVNLFIIIMCLFGNLKTFAPMVMLIKRHPAFPFKTTKRITPFIIFTEVHGTNIVVLFVR